MNTKRDEAERSVDTRGGRRCGANVYCGDGVHWRRDADGRGPCKESDKWRAQHGPTPFGGHEDENAGTSTSRRTRSPRRIRRR